VSPPAKTKAAAATATTAAGAGTPSGTEAAEALFRHWGTGAVVRPQLPREVGVFSVCVESVRVCMYVRMSLSVNSSSSVSPLFSLASEPLFSFHSCLKNMSESACYVSRVGQNHTYTVYIRYFCQGNHQIYGHIQCIYTVLANPICRRCSPETGRGENMQSSCFSRDCEMSYSVVFYLP